MLESMIYNSRLQVIDLADGLLKLQYGFPRVCSTVDAIVMVVDLPRQALAVGSCSTLVKLDFRQPFNSVNGR